jgi:arginase
MTSRDSVTLIGVPLDLGAKNLGVDIGPEAFRHAGIVAKLKNSGLEVHDQGNIEVTARDQLKPGNPRLRYLDEITRVNSELARTTQTTIKSGRRPVIVGGDHSINLGAFAGASTALDGRLGLIYFDGHGAKLAKSNLLHIGGSDFDQSELDLIDQENLHAFTLFDLLTRGLGDLIAAIDDLAERVPEVWVSLDLDSIDQIYAPGAGMPNAKGLNYREISTLAEYIGSHHRVAGVDIVEYNPLQDQNSKTAELGIELIAKFLGKNYSWYSSKASSSTPNRSGAKPTSC